MTTAINDFTLEQHYEKRTENRFNNRALIVLAIVIAMTIIGGSQVRENNESDWRSKALSGGVAMTESQLRDLVSTEKLAVYWTGSMPNALYTLDATKKNQSILTYLPEKNKSKNVIADARIIGTYFSPSAFSDSLDIATNNSNVSFKNANGYLVFYAKERGTGVFVAIPNTKYQIEIFDPIPGQALSIASLRDQLTRIGK